MLFSGNLPKLYYERQMKLDEWTSERERDFICQQGFKCRVHLNVLLAFFDNNIFTEGEQLLEI